MEGTIFMTIQYGYHQGFKRVFTIIEDQKVNEMYHNNESHVSGLFHLSPHVRFLHPRINLSDFYYLDEQEIHHYNGYVFHNEEITDEEAIKHLQDVLYYYQPKLQIQTMMECGSSPKDDRNTYRGMYLLNNNEFYTIFKEQMTYQLFTGPNYAPDFLLYKGQLNMNLYELSYEFSKLDHQHRSELSISQPFNLKRYMELNKEIKSQLAQPHIPR